MQVHPRERYPTSARRRSSLVLNAAAVARLFVQALRAGGAKYRTGGPTQ